MYSQAATPTVRFRQRQTVWITVSKNFVCKTKQQTVNTNIKQTIMYTIP